MKTRGAVHKYERYPGSMHSRVPESSQRQPGMSANVRIICDHLNLSHLSERTRRMQSSCVTGDNNVVTVYCPVVVLLLSEQEISLLSSRTMYIPVRNIESNVHSLLPLHPFLPPSCLVSLLPTHLTSQPASQLLDGGRVPTKSSDNF